jgi:hypothetical protein
MKIHIKVVSKSPPGGRCEFYDRTFFRIVGLYENVYYTLIPSNLCDEELTPPAVLVNGELVEPEDGLLLTPSELIQALSDKGAIPRKPLTDIEAKLNKAYEDFLGDV